MKSAGDVLPLRHYAGIPGPIVVEAVRDMRLGVDLSFQALE